MQSQSICNWLKMKAMRNAIQPGMRSESEIEIPVRIMR
jgi:hypothetical protein